MSFATLSLPRTTVSDQLTRDFYTRKLLLHSPIHQPATASSPVYVFTNHSNSELRGGDNGFDANVVMVLSVLLCALICSLGLNSIIRCALRCSRLLSIPGEQRSTRLANTGIKKKALKRFLTISYSAGLNIPNLDTECVICLSEFATCERVRILPKCHHGFHVCCIDKWLRSHSSCPTCRQCLIETCQKIVGCSQASSSETLHQQLSLEETIISIAPLEPEDVIRNYRGIS
uniref:RING-type E3 ubiquitin transferase n=1 Tax=Kalanchoe fedtschenkoi TaxID=63787 RepID=A0A7N0T9E9_KALFE